MTVFFWFAFPALAVCVVAALYPERITRPFAGSGRRRFTVQSAKEAAETIRILEMQLAEAHRPKPCPNCHHLAGWPTGAEVQESDRSDPAPHISAPAPVDNGIRDTPLANAETQAVDVAELRDAVGEGDTQLLPIIAPVAPVVPLHDAPLPPVTWGRSKDADTAAIEANLNTPAPSPEYAASAVPPGVGDLAHDKVHATLGEAS